MDSDFWFFAGGIGIVVVFLAVVLGTIAWFSSWQCSRQAERMGMPHDWALVQGCFVEHQPGKWINIERYRAFD